MPSEVAENTLPDGHRVITASGELDQIELPRLRLAIREAFATGARQLILDMSRVTYIDSSVLAALIADSIEVENAGRALVVVTGTGGVMRSLELKGLMQIMRIAVSIDDALASLTADS
jgi:anti-sigma B factor antagonist